MRPLQLLRRITPLLLALAGSVTLASLASGRTADGRPLAVLIAGKPSHEPGGHEHNAGVLLFAKCLAQGAPQLVVKTHLNAEWPDATELHQADTILIYCDGGPQHLLLAGDRLSQLGKEIDRGAGLMLLHYAVEFPTAPGREHILDWAGGFFEVNWSVNPVWTAHYTTIPSHPVTRGVQPFSTSDEWYFHMRFNDARGTVTPILSAVPDLGTLERPDGERSGNPTVRAEVNAHKSQVMSWAYERPDGGRAFSFTGGHHHKNWGLDDQRKLVLNAILWTAHVDVPKDGVASTVTAEDLAANLDPKPKRPPAPPGPPKSSD